VRGPRHSTLPSGTLPAILAANAVNRGMAERSGGGVRLPTRDASRSKPVFCSGLSLPDTPAGMIEVRLARSLLSLRRQVAVGVSIPDAFITHQHGNLPGRVS
jgi:hypothetical protein